jgi:predicted type IV restriction endonuclease
MSADIRKPLKKYLPHLLKAQEEGLNEADTVQRLIKVFEEVLGYDPMSDITREAAVKDRFVDVALKIDGAIKLLVEVKSGGTVLRHKHIEQAQNYAANGNIRWVVLTNGVGWHLYHLTFEEGIESTLAFAVDLVEGVTDKAAELLGLIHRQSVRKGELEEYWAHRVALSPASIARALFTEEALKFIRREIRRREGLLIDEEDLASAIHEMFSTEARERVGPLKIRRKQKARSKKPESAAAEGACPAPEPIPEQALTRKEAER